MSWLPQCSMRMLETPAQSIGEGRAARDHKCRSIFSITCYSPPPRWKAGAAKFTVPLPAALFVLVLLGQPPVKRREVVDDRSGIDVALAGERFERVRPWLRGTDPQHCIE